jgi:D-xylose reductase
MPLVGFGTWKVPNDSAPATVEHAIKCGYRLFDTACDYGNEKGVGEGIRNAINKGLVKREEVFVTTKLWNTFHAKNNVRPAFMRQLKDLGLDYVDLYLIHFPIPLEFVPHDKKYPPEWTVPGHDETQLELSPLHECWPELEKLVTDGLVRNIGVSNFNVQLIIDLLTYAKVKPVVNQVEIHPYLPQEQLVTFCKSRGMHVTAYSSFGPTSFIELDYWKAKEAPPLLENPVVKKIAKLRGRTEAQVLLRWAIQRDLAVIPKSNSADRLKSNRDLFDFRLEDEDLKELKTLDCNLRMNDPDGYGFGLPIFA